jgi:GntR family transcriptional regulator
MTIIERSNPLPLYYQLKEVLKQQIQSGHFAPNTPIPSEPELVARYHVSRATVRQALTELVHEGLLYRQHGKGTFVRELRIQQTVSELTSLTTTLRKQGNRPGSLLLISELTRSTDAIRQQLHLADADQVIHLERLRTADDIPIAYEIDYLPYPRAEGVYQHARELLDGSLYATLAAEGLIPSIAQQTLRVGTASIREAELLRIQPYEPGLRIACITFDQTGLPIALSESFYVGNRYEFQVSLRIVK